MAKQECIKVQGIVDEASGGINFKVTLDNGHQIKATLSGKLQKNYIRIMAGDRVECEMSVYDMNRGRIVTRL